MQQKSKVALITGANNGIGFEVARQADGLDVHFIHIDLDAHQTATTAAEAIRTRFGKLDLLINNAAIVNAGDGPPSKVKMDALTTVMDTNFVGAVEVTQAMLPLLKSAGKAQILNISSELGSISQ